MDSEPIVVDVQLTTKDLFQASLARMSWAGKSVLGFYAVACLLSVLLIIYSYLFNNRGPETLRAVFPMIPVALLMFGIIIGGMYFGAKSAVQSSKTLSGRILYTISADGIQLSSEHSQSSWNWTILHKAFETANAFLLYESKFAMYLIPKRSFSTHQQLSEFRELLKLKLGDQARCWVPRPRK